MTDLGEAACDPRTDGDSWDITESVGATALGVAAARAVETAGADPLIRDEFAQLLVSRRPDRVGPDGRAVDPAGSPTTKHGPCAARDVPRLPGGAHPLLRRVLSAPRSRAGIRQVVILAAGLDSRAYRLRLAGGHGRVRDRPAQSAGVQGRDAGRTRGAVRRRGGMPSRSTFATTGPRRWSDAGFDAVAADRVAGRGPAAIPAPDAQDRLFEIGHGAQRAGQPGSRSRRSAWTSDRTDKDRIARCERAGGCASGWDRTSTSKH